MKRYTFFWPLLAALVVISCNNRDATQRTTDRQEQLPQKTAQMTLPAQDEQKTLGEEIPVHMELPDTVQADSATVYLRGTAVMTYNGTDTVYVSTSDALPGKASVRVKLFFPGNRHENHSRGVTLLSDIEPVRYRYRVVNTYPHDVKAYTQGLIYHDGWLYEGTGQPQQSSIRKVKLETGEVIKIRNNAAEIFGEGITIFRDKLYQLTYKAQVCFIYDPNTFEEIKKVYYQNREGWGLTHNGEELIMSDGTHVIYFMEPELFTVKRQIEVYGPGGMVDNLNELEYIDGKIYANRYFTDEIVIIDPVTGKLEGRINLKGILSHRDRNARTDVLNGIAWDSKNDRLFVTGKYWPKLFEIEKAPLGQD